MRDIDIRRALLMKMEVLHPDKQDTLVVEELGMCQGLARIDVAVVNGTVHGFEIKSERDTLNRLRSQADIYSKALEYVTIVASASHVPGIEAIVPKWWGIWIASQDAASISLEEMKASERNPSLSANALVQFLWRDEAFEILCEYELSKGLAGKSRSHLWERLSTAFSVDELGDLVRSRLKKRPSSWRAPAPQA